MPPATSPLQVAHCYQLATPDVAPSAELTAMPGDPQRNFRLLSEIGYTGVELMTVDPQSLDWRELQFLSRRYGLPVVLVCTGELYGQLGLSFTDQDYDTRRAAVQRVKETVAFASSLGAHINIGRVRGFSDPENPKRSLAWASSAIREVCDYAANRGVRVLLEHIERLETNFITTLPEACEFIDAMNHPALRAMVDVFALYHEERDMLDVIERLSPHYNEHVHLSDSDRYYPGHKDVDFESVIRSFRNAGFTGAFVEEVLQRPDAETAARRSFAHIQPLLLNYYHSAT